MENTEDNKFNGDFEITQELIDHYAVLIGQEEGIVSVEMVEQVILQYADVIDRGFEMVIGDYDLTEFSKTTLLSIYDGETIENLESMLNYESLSVEEKEILSTANELEKLSSTEFERHSFGTGVGAFIGLIVGGFICSFLCVIAGAIVGGIVGASKIQ